MNKQDRIKGAIYGLLIGDAVGVPYEFNLPEQLPEYNQIDMLPPAYFSKTYPEIPLGTWSDDGAQALSLLDSLLYKHKMDAEDLMKRLCNWYQYGYMAVDYQVFDVGVQTAESIRKYLMGVPLSQVAKNDEHANGNGSLMRVLPLALWHQDQMGIVAACVFALWARSILNGLDIEPAWSDAVARLRQCLQDRPEDLQQLELYIRPDELVQGTGSGYVVDCLNSARYALQKKSYQDVIKSSIALGRDTDTTACVAGGIAGLYFGYHAIPQLWLNQLRGKALVEPLLEKLSIHIASSK
ncbi:hypothetical protein FQR65_LT16920 [Abscondita terminalis]|nr:hypothetical protein FQR65_LT16920 [Abscondita terminalis]